MEITIDATVECAKCHNDLKAVFGYDGDYDNPQPLITVEPCEKCLFKMVDVKYRQMHPEEAL